MEEYNCRTCLSTTDRRRCTEITKKCYLERTLREVITYLVPEMKPTLSDDELICRSCVRTLKLVMKFIEGCLEVEAIKEQNKDDFEDNIDGITNDQGGDIEYVKTKSEDESEDFEEEDFDDSMDSYYQGNEVDQSTVVVSESRSEIKLDHDYLNKHKVIYEYKCEDSEVSLPSVGNRAGDENDSNLVEYHPISEETVYDSSSIPVAEETGEGDQHVGRPIEIVYDDSLIVRKVRINPNEEGIIIPKDEITDTMEYIEYQEHDLEGKETKVLACETCSEVFTSNEGYQMHLDIHPPYKCQYCDKGLKTEVAYKSHILWHKEKGFKMCEFCGRCFKSNGALNMHINCTHEDETIYTCELCPKQYKHKFKLESHIKSVHMKIGRHQCQECGKLFQQKEACESHYRLIHLQIKPYMCEICGVEFGRKDYLQKHVQRHENNEEVRTRKPKEVTMRSPRIRLKNTGKPVICRICGKQIKTVHLLKAHLQTHVRIKRHKCKFCELTFTLATNRDRHEKLHESDPDNKFRCNICWKRVRTESDLEKHIAGHGNRPPQHSCDICGEKFHRRYLVDNHLLDKHTGPGDIEKAEEEIVFKNLLEYVDPRLLE